MKTSMALASALLCALTAAPAFAQAPAEPKVWTVAASAGLALTSGNADTTTVNAAYDITYDPQTRNVIKSDALFIRGETNDELTTSRLGLNARDQFALTTRMYVFGQNQYLRDEFKNIDYLIAPSAGVGYKLFDTTATQLSVDGGIGGVWEKNPLLDVQSSGAVSLNEKLVQNVTANTTVTQIFTGLWKTKDWDDSLITFGVALAAAMSQHTQLKVELLDTFKNVPPSPAIKKNDVAVLMAIVYKM